MEMYLTDTEIRVLGCLIEKEMTTPEYYPLSLNALTNACNQKSNRDPVMGLDEESVVRALDGLRFKHLAVVAADGGRVPKYRHLLAEKTALASTRTRACVRIAASWPPDFGGVAEPCGPDACFFGSGLCRRGVA